MYAAVMFGFALYTHRHLQNNETQPIDENLPLECFLDVDEIPRLFQKHAMETLNLVTVSIAVAIIVIGGLSNLFYRKYHRNGAHSFFASRPKLDSIWENFVVVDR